MRSPPKIDRLPFPDHVAVTLCWRLYVEAVVRKDMAAEIRALKALEAAERAAESLAA